jgi:uncharacterized protein YndB with AHSA1/START domain
MASLSNETVVQLTGDREITVTRQFDAPRWLVFDVWTRPEHMARWLGPRRMEMTACEVDLRPGGKWRYVHRDVDGTEYGFRGEFLEVVRPERLVQTFEFDGAPGHVSTDTLLLDERDGRTYATMISTYSSAEERDMILQSGMEGGMRESLERATELLESIIASTPHELTIERTFDAPRDLVFRAWTDAKHLARWWGPGHGFTNPVCEVDARPGGAILIHMRAPDGNVFPMTGRFEEVVAPERLVFSTAALGPDGQVGIGTVDTVTFADAGPGKTTVRLHVAVTKLAPQFAGALAGMELGWRGSLDQLADTLAAM